MSVVFSGTNQGVFTSAGTAKVLQIRTGVDFIRTINQTKIAANAASTGYKFEWQYPMANGTGVEYQSNAGANAVDMVWLTSGGFTLIDNTINNPGAAVALTGISNAAIPVVSTASTAGLSDGDIVRLYNVTDGQQLGGLDFTIGSIVANTSFTLAFMRQIATAGAGTYRRIPYDPYFYPPQRIISRIGSSTLNGQNVAIVTMTVTHAFTVGQKVRFKIPTVTALAFGMPALNDVEGTILATGAADAAGVTNTITVDVDVSALGTFAWPLSANVPFTPAQIVPVGANTAQANSSNVNPYADAEINQGFVGISLAAGTDSPAGVSNDVIYWIAGKSFNGQ